MYRTEPLLAGTVPMVTSLLETSPYRPFAVYVRDYGQEAIGRFFTDAVQGRLSSAEARSVGLWQGDRIAGLAVWSTLSLESQVFGFRTARLEYLLAEGEYRSQREIKRHLLTEVLDQCMAAQVRHISIRVDAADLSSIHALEESGFILVDGLITYGRRLEGGPWLSSQPGFQIRSISAADLPEVKALARSAYTLDRLHADPFIPKSAADEIHAVWIEKSSSPSTADQVLVAADGMGILGYSVFRVNETTIPYFGEPMGVWVIAATAERARARGVAKSLCYAMLDWHKEQGVRIVEGGTQLANVASARLHESCGFRVVNTGLSMSKGI
jgi:L-amino acid N-acyltransferase YncA